MALNCGILGLPKVGKSTVFSGLSSAKAEAANSSPTLGKPAS